MNSFSIPSKVSFFCGFASIFLGLLVLIGWYTRSPALIQIHPSFVPMQFNTALGFLTCGIGLLPVTNLIFKSKVNLFGVTAIAVGGLTLVEYFFMLDLGIDQLFMEHFITVKTSHPGRMAPNTALCFTLTGIALILISSKKVFFWKHHISEIIGALILGLGTVAFSGYMVNIETAYGWGNLTRMALHTSTGFIILGVGVVSIARATSKSENIGPSWFHNLIGITALTIVVCLWQALDAYEQQHELKSIIPTVVLVAGVIYSLTISIIVYLYQKEKIQAKIIENAYQALKTGEDKLIENQQRLELVLEGADLGTWDWNIQTDDVIFDDRLIEMLGYTRDEFGAHLSSWEKLVHPEDAPSMRIELNSHLEGKIPFFAFEYRLRHKSGHWLWILDKGKVVEWDNEGKPLRACGTHLDISKRKEMELELKQSYEELEKRVKERTAELEIAKNQAESADHLKNLFMASMSHELRTPLNSIIGFTGVILEGNVGEINPKQKDYLGRAYQSSKHLLGLISDIIDISKVEAGQIEAAPELFNLDEMVAEAVDNACTQKIKSKGLELKVEVLPGFEVYNDRKRILQCLINYLSNAVKFTQSGYVSVSAKEVGDKVEIMVEDTGIGIAEDDLPRLFRQFERLDSHLKIPAGGTGLGLYLTKKLATEVLDGSVGVDSRLGAGSKFFLKFPKNHKQKSSKNSVAATPKKNL